MFSTNYTMLGKLHDYIGWILAREPERNLPPITMIDYEVMERDYLFFDRNCKDTAQFAEKMEAWSGRKITEDDLRASIALYNEYRQALQDAGLTFCGLSPDGRLVEASELSDRPFFLGVQYHPEFKSRPTKAHPLFYGFIEASLAEATGDK